MSLASGWDGPASPGRLGAMASRPRPRLRSRAWLVGLALLVVACSITEKRRWAEARFEGLSFSVLYASVADLFEAEGFDVTIRDASGGIVESEWAYGTSRREVRGPSRRKAIAEVEKLAPGVYVVRVRVAEEVIRKGGLLATKLRDSDDWETFPDNFEDAEYLAAKLRAMLDEHQVPVEVDPDAEEDHDRSRR